MEPYIGRYFSAEHIKKKILLQTDTEREEIEKEIKTERSSGLIPSIVPVDAVLPENQPELETSSLER